MPRMPYRSLIWDLDHNWRVASRRFDMPRQKTTRHRDRHTNDPGYESRMQEALQRVRSGQFKSFREAGRILNVSLLPVKN